jgi:hypothetical protein
MKIQLFCVLFIFLGFSTAKSMPTPKISVKHELEKDYAKGPDRYKMTYFLVDNENVESLYQTTCFKEDPNVFNLIFALPCGADRMAIVLWEGDRFVSDSPIYLVIVERAKVHPSMKLNYWNLKKKILLSCNTMENIAVETDVNYLIYDGKNSLSYKFKKREHKPYNQNSSVGLPVPVGEEIIRTILIEE